MKTTIGPVVLETKGYDVIAELEQQEGKSDLKEFLLKHRQEAEDKARQFLADNPKPTYYIATGYPTDIPWDEVPEDMYAYLMCYSDEETQRLKQLIVDAWNQDATPEGLVASYDEIDPTTDLRELQGLNDELDQLLWGRAEDMDFDLGSINLNHPVHAYLFSTYEYNHRKQEMCPRKQFRRVILTDEEYLYLLTEQVNNRHFTFNRLLLYKPELAQNICDATAYNDPIYTYEAPYIILMDEVQSDMEKILGHEPLHEILCNCNENGHNYIANILVENDQIELAWQKVRDDDFSLDSLVEGGVTGIDAKAVMQLLEAKDYYEMVERISERFKDKTAYDDLLAYLHENGIFERDED